MPILAKFHDNCSDEFDVDGILLFQTEEGFADYVEEQANNINKQLADLKDSYIKQREVEYHAVSKTITDDDIKRNNEFGGIPSASPEGYRRWWAAGGYMKHKVIGKTLEEYVEDSLRHKSFTAFVPFGTNEALSYTSAEEYRSMFTHHIISWDTYWNLCDIFGKKSFGFVPEVSTWLIDR